MVAYQKNLPGYPGVFKNDVNIRVLACKVSVGRNLIRQIYTRGSANLLATWRICRIWQKHRLLSFKPSEITAICWAQFVMMLLKKVIKEVRLNFVIYRPWDLYLDSRCGSVQAITVHWSHCPVHNVLYKVLCFYVLIKKKQQHLNNSSVSSSWVLG